MSKKTTITLTYETAYKELNEIVVYLQQPSVSIDELTEKSKRAIELLNFCKQQLRNVEEETKSLFT